MGGYRWLQNFFLILAAIGILGMLAPFAGAATRKYVTMPSAQSVASGGGTASRSGGTLSIPGAAQGEYLPGYNQNRQIPIKVLPRIDFSIPRTIEHAKKGMRGGWAGVAASVGIGLALDQIPAKWGDDGFPYKEGLEFDGNPLFPVGGLSTNDICQLPASQTRDKYIHHSYNGVNYISTVHTFGANPSGFQTSNNCTNKNLGYRHNAEGYWEQSSYRVLSPDEEVQIIRLPLSESDYSAIGDWMDQQNADWLKDLLKDACSASPSPNRCFEEMAERSSLSGPTTVPGGSTTSTTTTTNADGTQSQTTATTTTTYNIKYGDNHYDYSQTRSTRITHPDGSTSEEVTSDPESDLPPEEEEPSYSHQDSDFPDVTPFYEVKYPDGLQSVWNAARERLDDSAFISFLHSFVPSFSGSCPSWSMGFNIATWANYGTQSFQSLCYVFDFIKVIMLVSAAFLCRAIVFGG